MRVDHLLVRTLCALVATFGVSLSVARAQTSTPPAGTLSGVVVDSQTAAPVPVAFARVLELHRAEATHEDGTFAFPGVAPGNYTLVVQRLGYRPYSQRIEIRGGETTRVRVAMNPAAVQLAPTVVTGTISERSGEDVLSPTSVVSGANLDRQVASTVASTLQSQPGVSVASLGPATARPVIRGLGGDRIVVLEDGVRAGDLSSTSADHAVAIEPLTAKQIEIVRGPMSLLYGSSALGGVVNVIREEIPSSLPEHYQGAVSVQGLSVNRGVTAAAAVSTRVGSFAVRGEGSARGSGDTRTPVGRLINTDARTYTGAAGAAYVGGWGHAGASYRFYDNDYGIPGGFVGGHEQGVEIRMRRHMLRAETELHREDRFVEAVHVGGSFTDYYHVELEPSGALGTRFDQTVAAGDAVARHGGRGVLSEGAIGLRGQYRDIRTGGTLRTPSTYDYTLAGFLVEEIGRGPLRVQLGARYDWSRYVPRDRSDFVDAGGQRIPVRPRTFGSVSASLGLLYSAAEGVRLGASVNRAYRTPDFNELYSNGPHLAANSFDVGDPSLKQETGIGVDVFVRAARGPVRAEVAAFRNALSDYIFPSSRGRAELGTQGGRPRFQYTNEDALFSGVEGQVDWSALPSLVFEGTLSYVRARFTSTRAPIPIIGDTDTTFVAASQYPPFIPPLNGRLGVRYERPRYFAGAGVRAASAQERLGDFETRTAGSAVGDVTAGVRFPVGRRLHSLTLRVENVTNRAYRDHLSRVKEIRPEPGRNVSLLYRLAF